MTGLPWLRLYTEYATDPKIQILAFDDQRHFVMLLCLKGNGTLDCDVPNEGYRERLVAKALGLDTASAMEAKRRLVEGGLIAIDWQPCRWGDRQPHSDHNSAERQKRYRENKKRDGNDDVTTPLRDSDAIDKIRLDKTRQDKNQDMSGKPDVGPAKPSPEVTRGSEVQRVFDHWREVWGHPHAKLDAKRKAAITAALKLGYEVVTLCESISGYKNSDHHTGKNERSAVFDELTLFLRDAAHIDAGLRHHQTPLQEKGKWT